MRTPRKYLRISADFPDTKRSPDEVDDAVMEKNKLIQRDFPHSCGGQGRAVATNANHSRGLPVIIVFHMLLILHMVLIISSWASP
jgi:hypothetical protein